MSQALYRGSTIRQELSLHAVVDRVEEAFVARANNETQMPPKSYLFFEAFNGDLRSMPAYVPRFNLATVKVVNAHPDNPQNHDLPTVMALILAVDPETGEPRALLDGTELTAYRTAAASALSTRLFAPSQASTLGLIGTGKQARYQVTGQFDEISFDRLLLYDLDSSRAEELKKWARDRYPDVTVAVKSEPREVVGQSDVVISVTPSRDPLMALEDIPESILINALGADAPRKQEWPGQLLQNAAIIVDDWDQASHSGEISQAVESATITRNDLWGTLGQFLADPPQRPSGRVLFDSTGLAIQDTAATSAVLESDVQPDESFDFLD